MKRWAQALVVCGLFSGVGGTTRADFIDSGTYSQQGVGTYTSFRRAFISYYNNGTWTPYNQDQDLFNKSANWNDTFSNSNLPAPTPPSTLTAAVTQNSNGPVVGGASATSLSGILSVQEAYSNLGETSAISEYLLVFRVTAAQSYTLSTNLLSGSVPTIGIPVDGVANVQIIDLTQKYKALANAFPTSNSSVTFNTTDTYLLDAKVSFVDDNSSDTQNASMSFSLDPSGPPSAAPEPASLTLLGIGACALMGYGWKRRKAKS